MISERQQIAEDSAVRVRVRQPRYWGVKKRISAKLSPKPTNVFKKFEVKRMLQLLKFMLPHIIKHDSVAFYQFIKTMETYKEMLDRDSTMVFTTQSDIFKF